MDLRAMTCHLWLKLMDNRQIADVRDIALLDRAFVPGTAHVIVQHSFALFD
jgi:hypothetical protein